MCESADAPPLWRIGDTNLTDSSIIERYFGEVKLRIDDVTGSYQSTLILKHVNFTLNGSIVSCSANSNLILNLTLVVGEYTYYTHVRTTSAIEYHADGLSNRTL